MFATPATQECGYRHFPQVLKPLIYRNLSKRSPILQPFLRTSLHVCTIRGLRVGGSTYSLAMTLWVLFKIICDRRNTYAIRKESKNV
jgi:hypothetical protein